MQHTYDLLDPMFLATRETFPGEWTFHELSERFFTHESSAMRAMMIDMAWSGGGVLVHMANPEQIDDLFAHIDREKRVRYLSTTYLHQNIRTSVYAIGRGTGILLDPSAVSIEHVSVNDCRSETDHVGRLVAENDLRVSSIADLHAALLAAPRDDWNEVNASFEGPTPILGFFALDGVLSKLYATALWIKAGGLLPVFTYNRGANRLAEFRPTRTCIESLIDQVSDERLRDRYRTLLSLVPSLEEISTGQS